MALSAPALSFNHCVLSLRLQRQLAVHVAMPHFVLDGTPIPSHAHVVHRLPACSDQHPHALLGYGRILLYGLFVQLLRLGEFTLFRQLLEVHHFINEQAHLEAGVPSRALVIPHYVRISFHAVPAIKGFFL